MSFKNATRRIPIVLTLLCMVVFAPSCADEPGGQSGSGLSCTETTDCDNGKVCLDQQCLPAATVQLCASLDDCACLANSDCLPITEACFCPSLDTTCSGFEELECVCSGGGFLGCQAAPLPDPAPVACDQLDDCDCMANSDCAPVVEACFCPSVDTTCTGFENEECVCSGGAFLGCQDKEDEPLPVACEELDDCECMANSECAPLTEACFCPSVDTTCSGFENEECICSGGAFLSCGPASAPAF